MWQHELQFIAFWLPTENISRQRLCKKVKIFMGIIYYLVAFLYTHILYCLNRYQKIIKLLLTLKLWTLSREKVQKYANYCLVVFQSYNHRSTIFCLRLILILLVEKAGALYTPPLSPWRGCSSVIRMRNDRLVVLMVV